MTAPDATTDLTSDLTSHHIEGITFHGDLEFSIPLLSHIDGNLWMGGCRDGVALPDHIDYVVSLYLWEQYELHPGALRVEFRMYDADLIDEATAISAARHVLEFLALGTTLVHCQAGLNRSGLVAALALIAQGRTAEQAIGLLRSRRSHAVLCNPTFERALLEETIGWAPSQVSP